MSFLFSAGGGGSTGSGSETEESKTNTTGTKTSSGTSTTTNSGHTDTGSNMTTGNTYNSGRTDTTTVGPSSSTTFNSGRVDTAQVLLTPEAVDHLIKQMLSSNQGLAAVSGAQHASGAYNTTTNTLLTNDLLTKVAGEVAVRGAKTVNTIGSSSSTTTNSGNTTTSTQGASYGANASKTDLSSVIGSSTSTTNNSSLDNLVSDTLSQGTKDSTKKEAHADTKAGWIVCTELHKQGRMPRKFYMHGLRAFAKYNEATKKGYYIWAVPATKHLRRSPTSIVSRFLDRMLNARAEYLSAEAGESTARKTILGYIAKQLQWGCWILGHTVARNYQVSPTYNGVYNA